MNKWVLPVGAAAAGLLASILVYADLPASMAVHFGTSDQPDRWMARPFGAFLLPVLSLAIAWLVTAGFRLERDPDKRRRAEASAAALGSVVALTLLAVHLFIIAYNLGYEISVSASAVLLIGLVFLFIGNLLPRLPQSSLRWPRLPDGAARKAHRFLGRFMFATGLALLPTAALPLQALVPVFAALLVVFLAVSVFTFIRFSRL